MPPNGCAFIDKTGWRRGEWDQEKDFYFWLCDGVPCFILRHGEIGHLCGYVVLRKDHPDIGKDFDYTYTIHGGITFSGAFKENFFTLITEDVLLAMDLV